MLQKKPPLVNFSEKTESWLTSVQNSLINTQGVFFIRGLPPEIYYNASNEVETAWQAYCKLARRICKVYMLATQHRPYDLHGGIDIFDGPQKSCTNLVHCFSPSIEAHIDRGIFNIVYGTVKDISGLELLIKGQFWDCGSYFKDVEDDFLCVVIPGFGLEAFDDCFSAVRHRVKNASTDKKSVNFQCRFHPSYKLPSGKSVDEATRLAFENGIVKKDPDQFLVVDIQSPCGSYRAVLQADPVMTAEELKAIFVTHTEWNVNPDDLGLICLSGVGCFFEESCLKDLAGDMDYPEPLRFTAYTKHRKRMRCSG